MWNRLKKSSLNEFSDGNKLLFYSFKTTLSLQLEWELEVCEKESGELQEYANSVLQQIADYCPDILEQVVNALEESC